MESTIHVNFGKQGYSEMWSEMRKHLTENGPKEEVGRAVEAGASYLIRKVISEMKIQGYRSIGLGRAIFEDALDYQARFKVAAVIKHHRNTHKVPKQLVFTVSVPKVE